MAKIKIYSQAGVAGEDLAVSDKVFKVELNTPLIHEVVVAQRNNQRQGTKSTLTRSEVRGHAKKPYRQKGTGNARQGSTKGPHQIGGGVAFAPKPRDFSTKINKTKKDQAFKSAISAKLADGELIGVKEINLKLIKTAEIAKMLEKLKLDQKRVLIVTEKYDASVLRATRNIPNVNVTTAGQLSVLDVVNNKICLPTVAAIKKLEEIYE
ncbi:MAG: 50S ribosomal protein L4 [Firmicutes bacterium]|nr:50S ribosomal protein L4 [Bacillota bacterium]